MGDDVRRCTVISLNIPPSKNHQTETISQASKARPNIKYDAARKNDESLKFHPISKTSSKSKTHQELNFNPTFERERKKLEVLSDRELLGNLQKINQKERRLKILVLLYLSEIDTRELYLPMGCSSLFDFCTMHLGYTRATAVRRIRAARAAAKYPEALELLVSGEINITTLSMISDILDRDNHGELLSKIRGRSTRQVELLVSMHRPVPVVRDTVRQVCIKRRIQESDSGSGVAAYELSRLSAETNQANPDAEERRNSNKISSSAGTRIILEQRLKLGFSVSPEFMAKYNKIKSLLSGRHPEGINFEMLFDILMNEYLEKHDPVKKHARRAERAKKRDKIDTRTKKLNRQGTRAGTDTTRNKSPDSRRSSRRIPHTVRDQVYARDKGRCTFIGANGKRCNAAWDLEIDHIVPVARGGDNSPGNLRLLCRKHNIYQAEKIYGREHMKNRSG
jgi:hypothetical protein